MTTTMLKVNNAYASAKLFAKQQRLRRITDDKIIKLCKVKQDSLGFLIKDGEIGLAIINGKKVRYNLNSEQLNLMKIVNENNKELQTVLNTSMTLLQANA